MEDFRLLVCFVFGALAVTINKGVKYKFLEATATPERKEHAMQGPQLPDCTNVTSDYPASVLTGDLSPWRHLTACIACHEVGTTTMHWPLTLDQRHTEFAVYTS